MKREEKINVSLEAIGIFKEFESEVIGNCLETKGDSIELYEKEIMLEAIQLHKLYKKMSEE